MFDDKKRKQDTQHPTGMEENSRRNEFQKFYQLIQHYAGLSVLTIVLSRERRVPEGQNRAIKPMVDRLHKAFHIVWSFYNFHPKQIVNSDFF